MTTPDTIRWGILGTGGIAGAFAEALHLLPDAELSAVGSRTAERAATFGDRFHIPNRHAAYERLAEDPEVDVVYIATPHAFHARDATLCLKAGKHVLCEKAFTINAREARTLVDTARHHKRFLMEAMYTRHLPAITQVRAWIKEGGIGDARMAQATRCATGEYDPAARHMNLALGGGSLLDVGIYPLSFLCMAFRATPEAAHGHALLGESGADEHGSAVLRFPNGGIGTMHFGLHTNAIDDARIYGTDGYITIEPPFWGASRATLVRYNAADKHIDCPIEGNGLQFEAAETMRCIRQGLSESPVMPLNESIALMQVMDDLRKPWGLDYPNDSGCEKS
jgi:dihydrodiol dehydrogenase / D-xylose 1-dehydrogenase (NADP)